MQRSLAIVPRWPQKKGDVGNKHMRPISKKNIILPAVHAESSFDVTCCQESDTSKAVCGQNNLFVDDKEYQCINGHPLFFHFCLYAMHLEHIAHLYKMEDDAMRALDRNS